MFIDYYDILEINPFASSDTIKYAYRKMTKLYHPDVYKEDDAHKKMALINEAKDTLLKNRKDYDKKWRSHYINLRKANNKLILRDEKTNQKTIISEKLEKFEERFYVITAWILISSYAIIVVYALVMNIIAINNDQSTLGNLLISMVIAIFGVPFFAMVVGCIPFITLYITLSGFGRSIYKHKLSKRFGFRKERCKMSEYFIFPAPIIFVLGIYFFISGELNTFEDILMAVYPVCIFGHVLGLILYFSIVNPIQNRRYKKYYSRGSNDKNY